MIFQRKNEGKHYEPRTIAHKLTIKATMNVKKVWGINEVVLRHIIFS